MTAVASKIVDPSEMSAAQLRALRAVRDFRMSRVTSGWRAPGSPFVSRQMASALTVFGLVHSRYDAARFKHVLALTGGGHATLAVADERAERRVR